MSGDGIGVRVQNLALQEQAVVLARLAQMRSEAGDFTPSDLSDLFSEMSLPPPAHIPATLAGLRKKGLVRSKKTRGKWQLTPIGRSKSEDLLSDFDISALAAEAAASQGPRLGRARHPVITPAFAPPELLRSLRQFLSEHPFDTNIFGMTRFPQQDLDVNDPIRPALKAASETCRSHGLGFHLASDRALVDDLWTNVAAHMWACRYGIAFFEDRLDRGLNYNLTIEVGGMLMSGRRCALLKDTSLEQMPTDLVGRIYRPVDLDDPESVGNALHEWIRDDLRLGACANCR